MKILNIYGQYSWHTEARIVGNREGLLQLKTTIERAIFNNRATTEADVTDCNGDTALFASDGEGYEVIVEMHNDGWGLKAGSNSYWDKRESCPEYTSLNTPNKEIK